MTSQFEYVNPELTEIKEYSGHYKTIRFKLKKWKSPQGNSVWNYYIFLYEPQFKKEDWAKIWLPPEKQEVWGWNYFDCILTSLYFHGGMTFYEKFGLNSKYNHVQLGCDYNHAFDEDRIYEKEFILCDCVKTIRTIFELFPDILLRCLRDGKFYPQKEMIEKSPNYWIREENQNDKT